MKPLSLLALVSVLVSVDAGHAAAQRIGAQINWADEVDIGAGVRAEVEIPNLISTTVPFSRTFLIASFDRFFWSCDECSYWEVNANLAFPIISTIVNPYAGGGINIARIDLGLDGLVEDDADTDLGLNLLIGLRFPLAGLAGFAEARYELAGGDQFVITVGALLGR